MSIILDSIVSIIGVVIIIKDTVRGFIKAFMDLVGHVVSILLAVAFSPKLAAWIDSRFMLGKITSGINTLLTSMANDAEGSKLAVLGQSEMFQGLVEKYGANPEDVNAILAGGGEASEESILKLSNTIAAPVSNLISYAIAFAAIFFVSLIAIKIVAWLLSKASEAAGAKATDKALGFVFGLITAVLTCWIISIIASYLVVALGALNSEMFGQAVIDQTSVVRFLASFNPFKGVIDSLISSALAALK